MEDDDQLRLRVDATGGESGRLAAASWLASLMTLIRSGCSICCRHERAAQQMFNQLMFDRNAAQGGAGRARRLDADWDGVGGLKGLRYEALSRSDPAVALSFDLERLHIKARLRASKLR